jgi:tetratricopeptide (TPR) repeat protein
VTYFDRANVWTHKNDHDKAIADYNQAILLDSRYAGAFCGRRHAWLSKGSHNEAFADFDQAIRLDPQYELAFLERGKAWSSMKKYDAAIADFSEAIRLNPSFYMAYASCARIWASSADAKFRDAKRGLELATKACELTKWKEHYSLSILAMAHAVSGDYASAFEWQTRANELNKDPAATQFYRYLSNEFQAKRPFVDRD